ncbi:MAG: RagB/SusD family nutrient uptake outer membrane protein [Bacteroidales bacterium]|nr:RagB/SusD family nutrient uptake outer membrane protein [Bacteroidales bacterium]
MMKKLIIYFLVGMISTSCTDWVDVDPVNERVIKDMEGAKSAMALFLSSSVDPIRSGDVRKSKVEFLPAFNTTQQLCMLQSDEVDSDLLPAMSYIVWSRYLQVFPQTIQWAHISGHKIIWEQCYDAIGYCNQILTELKYIEAPEKEKQLIKGEAKVIRAINIFKVLQFFCVYDQDEYGIPLNLDSENVVEYAGARKSQTEVYQILIDELNEVLGYTAEKEYGYSIFYDKTIVHALLAQIYNFKGLSAAGQSDDWNHSITHASMVLDKISLVTNPADYKSMFFQKEAVNILDQNNKHALLVFYWGRKSGISRNNMWGDPKSGAANNGIPVSQELASLYEEDDIRYYKLDSPPYEYNGAFVMHNPAYNRTFVSKYPYERLLSNHETYAMFRAEEMHLIIAEAYARMDMNTEAKQWLDTFKVAKNTSFYSSGDLKEEVVHERRKEFIGEHEVRWLDMKRTGFSFSRNYNPGNAGDISYELKADDYRYAFRIPDNELSYNKSLTQNPKW